MKLLIALLTAVLLASCPDARSDGTKTKTKTKTKRSGTTCTTTTEKSKVKKVKNACVEAVADAFRAGCAQGSVGDILEAVDSSEDASYAEALAQIVVSASVTCTSEGTGTACAKAKSRAKAAAKSTAKGFSSAIARGLSTCECIRGDLFPGTCAGTPCESADDIFEAIFTDAWVQGMAEVYVELAAFAQGKVEAKVCVEAGEEGYSKAAATCVGKAAAHIVAKAVANVLIAGGCYTGTDVFADIHAFVNADITVSTECDVIYEFAGANASAILDVEARAWAVTDKGVGTATTKCFGDWCDFAFVKE